MASEPQPQPLDYRGTSPNKTRSAEDAESIRWRYRRVIFRVGVILLFLPVTFYFGPNLINFGKLTSLSPADFVSEVQMTCVPTVRAMKEYQRDTGHLPNEDRDLVPKYLPAMPNGQHINDGQFVQFTQRGGMHFIKYNFTPGAEGWRVDGPFANGQVPVPPVAAPPK